MSMIQTIQENTAALRALQWTVALSVLVLIAVLVWLERRGKGGSEE